MVKVANKILMNKYGYHALCAMIFILFFKLSAAQISQNILQKKLSVRGGEISTDHLIKELKNLTGVQFSFNPQQVVPAQKMKVGSAPQSVLQWLQTIENTFGVQYKLLGSHIIFADARDGKKPVRIVNAKQVDKPMNGDLNSSSRESHSPAINDLFNIPIGKITPAVNVDENELRLHGVSEDAKTKINYQYNDGTPLIIAVRNGNIELVKLLLQQGADVNKAVQGDGSPLITACKYGFAQIASFLVEKGANVNQAVPGDGNPLIAACKNRKLNIVPFLLEKGADVNAVVDGDGTPLINAIRSGNLDLIKYLLYWGADVNKAAPGDGNPLIAACKYGFAQIASLLVEKGANVNAIVPGDETPLINASIKGDLDMVKYLVSKGADVNLTVNVESWNNAKSFTDGPQMELYSPLNQAIKYGHSDVASYLRDKGAKR